MKRNTVKDAEIRIRERIRQVLGSRALSRTVMRKVEDEVLILMRDYTHARHEQRDEVYAAGERRILEVLRT